MGVLKAQKHGHEENEAKKRKTTKDNKERKKIPTRKKNTFLPGLRH
jgi:hypothetical protein